MVTRKEIVDELCLEIEKATTELKALEDKHKKFEEEHKADDEREAKYEKAREAIDALASQKYKGNWGSRDNWYYSRVPSEFLFNKEDKNLIGKALNELRDEKEMEIENSEEYKKLSETCKELMSPTFSEEHKELDKKIEDLRDTIRWTNQKIQFVQSRSGLIQEAKSRKRYDEETEKRKQEQEKIKEYKELILKRSKEDGE